jgi:cell wall-associated NlpC family hydrolase
MRTTDSTANSNYVLTAEELIVAARSLLGVPWMHQGRTRLGVDCIGLVALSFRQAGFDFWKLLGSPDRRDYGRCAHPDLLQWVQEAFEPISKLTDGCVILMKDPGGYHPRHFGIYAQGNVIHADARNGHVVEHGYRGLWKTRCQHSLWKIKGVLYAADCS